MVRITGVAATRLYRSIMRDVRWCPNCRVPVIDSERCPRCGSKTVKVRLTPPGDVRPAFSRDHEQVRRLIRLYVGRRAVDKLAPSNSIMLLNKVQAADAADEVIVGGRTIGVRLFDIYRRRWVFKPDYVGAMLIVEEKLGYYAIARRLKPGAVLEKKDLIEYDLPSEPGLYVALSDGRGAYGVGKIVGDGAIRVQKTWVEKTVPELYTGPASINKLLDVFSYRLDELEKEAVRFLETLRGKGTIMIALSGGKDSTVAAALAAKAGFRKGYFFDTGIEFPETINTAKRVAEKLDIDLMEISAGDTFWKALEIYGPPARDYRWCCKVVKFGPLVKALKPIVRDRLVTITGQRGFESTQRAKAGRIAPSATTGKRDLLAAPIQWWTSLDVYLYIMRERLPLNPLYEMGYERIGCYLCPTSRLAEIELARRTHPELWGRWESYLYRFARERGLPSEWIEYGFWRWRFSYPAEMIHLAKKLGLNPYKMLEKLHGSYVSHSVEFGAEKCHVLIPLNIRVANIKPVYRLLKTTGLDKRARLEGNTIIIVDEELKVKVKIYANGRVEVCGNVKPSRQFKAFMHKVLAPLYMVGSCYGCEVCVASCPYGAMVAAHTVIVDKCRSCLHCTYVCPSGGKLSEHAVSVLERSLES